MASKALYQRETQYLGFHPINIVDLVINAINDYVVEGAQSARKYLLEQEDSPFKDDDAAVTETISVILSFIQDAVDKYFDKFELYCFRNVFAVPAGVVVPGDLPMSPATESEEQALDKEIEALRQQIHQLRYYNQKLKTSLIHIQTGETAKAQTLALEQTCQDLCRREHVPTLPENINFVVDQSQRLLETGQTVLAKLHSPPGSNSTSAHTPAAKRPKVTAGQVSANQMKALLSKI
eukprot:TRINITY_DN5356_c0_g3_i1.p1 TRINITY_DN5356_c0_g3~~TRINITY_DN5356_c0_g3_i1.p1  ORF type:complete len:244 (+),score=57.84 TRINITY_DN5356_c0_g3_i1:25-732(+)